MPTIAESLGRARTALRDAGIPNARQDAASLLRFCLGRDTAFLYAHPEYRLSEAEAAEFDRLVERRSLHEPLQYIRGQQEFYGLDFLVTPDVLIPRPETEMLVERAIGLLAGRSSARLLEIGLGTGCITISILKNSPGATAEGCDISDAALAVARQNALHHQIADRVEFVLSDVYAKLPDAKYDLIASNPPYVPLADLAGLQPEVRDFEPHLALSDGADGLSLIRRIIDGAPRYLKPGGSLLIEIGSGQADAVRGMFRPAVWADVAVEPDLQGIPRMAAAKYLQ